MAKGYTKIENDLLDFLYSVNLSGAELQILIFIIRNSKGFHRTTMKASYTFVSYGTGLSISTCKRAIKKFIDKGFISEKVSPSGTGKRIISVEWSKLNSQSGQVRPHKSVKDDHPRVVKDDHQEIKEEIKTYKENNKETDFQSKNELPDDYYPTDEEYRKMLEEDDW